MAKKEVREIPFEGLDTVARLREIKDQIARLEKEEEELSASVKKHLAEVGADKQEWGDAEGNLFQVVLGTQDRRTVDEDALITHLKTTKPNTWNTVMKMKETVDEAKLMEVIAKGEVTQDEIPMKGVIVRPLTIKKIVPKN